jgi:hypothetical protein
MGIHRGVSSSPERIRRPEPKQKFRLTIPASVFP